MIPALAEQIAEQLMLKHGLTDWSFRWSRAPRTFGTCNWYRKTISLSRPLVELNAMSEVLDTILHEIAHALEPYHGHDRQWKRRAVEVGCKPAACYHASDVVAVAVRWRTTCQKCGKGYKRRKPPRADRQYYCPVDKTELTFHRRAV